MAETTNKNSFSPLTTQPSSTKLTFYYDDLTLTKTSRISATMGKYQQQREHPKYDDSDYWCQVDLSTRILLQRDQFWDMGETLPGRGQKTKPSCGNEIGFYKCPSCGTTEGWSENCTKAQCPVCFEVWLKRRTRESSEKLLQIDSLLTMPVKHIIYSPPSDWNGKDLGKILKKSGLLGGLVVRHPWRFRELATGNYLQWKHCDINPKSEKKTPSYAIRALHFHVLGFGYLKPSKQFHKETSWIYKNRGPRKGKQIPRTLYYLLSHTGIHGRKQTVRWFGICANNKFHVDIEIKYKCRECPTCQEDMEKYAFYDGTYIKVNPERKRRFKYYRFKEWPFNG